MTRSDFAASRLLRPAAAALWLLAAHSALSTANACHSGVAGPPPPTPPSPPPPPHPPKPAPVAPAAAAEGANIASLEHALQDSADASISNQAGGVLFLPDNASGRWRWTDHDGYKFSDGERSGKVKTFEISAIGSLFYETPAPIGSGTVQLGAFAGYDNVQTSISPSGAKNLENPGPAGNGSVIFGASALYGFGANYVLATAAGQRGETKLDSPSAGLGNASFPTMGFGADLVSGHIVTIGAAPDNFLAGASVVKLDVRAGLAYAHDSGNPFDLRQTAFAPSPGAVSASVESLTASIAFTLFSDIARAADAVWRPYIKVKFEDELSYRGSLEASANLGRDLQFSQADKSVLGELGVGYQLSSATFNAAAYVDGAADRTTLGVRLGAVLKLN